VAVVIGLNGAPVFSTSSYQVIEDATPIDPSSTAGGTGSFTIVANELTGDKRLIDGVVTLSDGSQGITEGSIDVLSGDGTLLTITGNSLLNSFNASFTANPYSGTLLGALTYYLGLVGVTTGFAVDPTIASRTVVFPGWYGNGWDMMKQLCAGQQVELTLVSDIIVMRPIRTNVAQVYRDESLVWTVDNTQIAQEINIFYYQSVAHSAALAYPVTSAEAGEQIYQVDANQQLVVNVSLAPGGTNGTGYGASVSSVLQPVATDGIPEYYAGVTSVYSIIDQNNNVYPAAKWIANGGSVTVTIGADTQSLVITIQGPNDTSLGPYRLALPTDSTNTVFYSTLNIIGNGVFYNKQLLTIPTGNSTLQTAEVAGTTIDDFAINTIGDAYAAAMSALTAATGPAITLAVTTHGINTRGNSGNYTLITFAQFDAQFGGNTFSYADTLLTPTFIAADNYLFTLVKSSFSNQAFGNIAGARRLYDNSYYRITSATISPDDVQYTAVQDNTFSDWDTAWGTPTFSYFDSLWGGKTFLNYAPNPLKAA